jgi:hypothetical protein
MASSRADTLIKVVAVAQFIPIFLYPLESLQSVSVVILALAALFFVFLGYNVWRHRQWAKTLTIFLQGFNIIARIMMFLSNATEPLKAGGGAHWVFIVTCLIAIALSGIVLYRFDVPEVEVAFAG